MGPAYFVIAILGCADGGTSCTQVATLQTQYVSEEQCSAATAAALIENTQFDYPTLVARCAPADKDKKSAAADEKPREKGRHG